MADTIRRSLSPENDEKELAAFPEPNLPAEKHSWFRSPLFQIHVVGFCAFLAPGAPFRPPGACCSRTVLHYTRLTFA